ncbi:MAG: glycosyltransferase [Anaerolineae bacterium]
MAVVGGMGAQRRLRVLILISDTGGGHRSAAQALAEGFHARLGDRVSVEIADVITQHTFWPLNQMRRTYRPMVNEAMWLWRTIWYLGERRWVIKAIEEMFTPLTYRRVAAFFRQQAPDLVITVHPLINHAAVRILRRAGSVAPFVTVVTDLVTAPPTWFCPQVDLCCVPTEAARERALRYGMRPDQVVVTGMPVSLKFHLPAVTPDQRRSKRLELGLDPDLATVLLLSGGEGMGPVQPIAEAIASALQQRVPAQMAIICGRNRSLQQRLSRHPWPIPVSVQGFVDNMPDWMTAADCVVTKAGPGTISEALIMGLPILLSGYIPGQETGNVPYVVDQGVGAYAEQPAEIARIVTEWLRPGNPELIQMRQRARSLARPDATLRIVDEILKIVDRPLAPQSSHKPRHPRTASWHA